MRCLHWRPVRGIRHICTTGQRCGWRLRFRRRGKTFPCRRRSPGDRPDGVGRHRGGHHAARQGARSVPRRCLPRAGGRTRWCDSGGAQHLIRSFPPRSGGDRERKRGTNPGQRYRPDPRRSRNLACTRRQFSCSERGQLRHFEPASTTPPISNTPCSPG